METCHTHKCLCLCNLTYRRPHSFGVMEAGRRIQWKQEGVCRGEAVQLLGADPAPWASGPQHSCRRGPFSELLAVQLESNAAATWSLVQGELSHLPWATLWGFLLTLRDATEAASVSPFTYQVLQRCPPPSQCPGCETSALSTAAEMLTLAAAPSSLPLPQVYTNAFNRVTTI